MLISRFFCSPKNMMFLGRTLLHTFFRVAHIFAHLSVCYQKAYIYSSTLLGVPLGVYNTYIPKGISVCGAPKILRILWGCGGFSIMKLLFFMSFYLFPCGSGYPKSEKIIFENQNILCIRRIFSYRKRSYNFRSP